MTEQQAKSVSERLAEEKILPPLTNPEQPALPDQAAEEKRVFARPKSLKELKPGMWVEGRVTSVAIYGVFVDIGVGREGLVHISQLSDRPVSSPTEVVQIGDVVPVRVLEVDPRSKRISLTMREQGQSEADPEKLRALSPGTVLSGTVTSLTRFGAFVDIGVGRDGLVPLSQLGRSGAEKASDVLQIGERVRVRVMDVDAKTGRIRLSMRNVYDPEQLARLQPGAIVRGRVTSLASFGAFVDLGVGKDGLIHVSELGDSSVRHPQEVLQVGQEVEVRVLDVDPETQRISLSMRLEEEPEWTPEPEEPEEEAPAGEATLEDLVARFAALRPTTRVEPPRVLDRGEREKQAVREALRRTLRETQG
ncbi:MAG: S1 RNA-binding domain-containing protein [Chloroflexia bacterium]